MERNISVVNQGIRESFKELLLKQKLMPYREFRK